MLKNLVHSVPNVLKEWSQLQLINVAGIVACMFLVIPSAGAVDALKTCTCLLRECRYSILIAILQFGFLET